MDKLVIGVMVDEYYLPTSGGGFSYYRTLLKGINEYDWDNNIEIVNIVFYKKLIEPEVLKKRTLVVNINYIYSVAYVFHKIVYIIFHSIGKKWYKNLWQHAALQIAKLRNAHAARILAKNNIDLVYSLKPEENNINYPFIATHWDVGHRSMYAFPEMAMNRNYEIRENYYTTILNKAFLIICESETGAKELQRFYGLNADRVKVVPIFSGEAVRQEVTEDEQQQVLRKYNLEHLRFFLYPAQFWAHKNHYNLLQAFHMLSSGSSANRLKLMLCGSDKGNLGYIRQAISRMGMEDRVVLPGYVTDKELHVFYKNALALVMPTFLGPTNIPLIEAAELGCPVLCSDLEGHREILQDTALYFDPSDAVDISRSMKQIQDMSFRRELIAQATQRISASSFSIGKSLQLLERVLLQARPIRKTWGTAGNLVCCLITCSALAA